MLKKTIGKGLITITKTDVEQRVVKGVVYEPNLVDSQGDWMEASEIQKSAYSFMKQARTASGVDTNHSCKAVEAYVCESYIAKAGDPDNYVEGSWIVAIKVDDQDTWDGIMNGDYEGLSMFGQGFREEGVEPEA